jgi:hypothetical protein
MASFHGASDFRALAQAAAAPRLLNGQSHAKLFLSADLATEDHFGMASSDIVIIGGAIVGSLGGLGPARGGLCRVDRADRARPAICTCSATTLSCRLDPPAVLDRRKTSACRGSRSACSDELKEEFGADADISASARTAT